MGLYQNGYKVLEGSFIVATDGVSLKPLADDTYYLGSTAYRWAGGYFGGNGIDVNPDSDVDADLITMSVTGTPKLWWDESDNRFTMSHGLDIDAGQLIVNGAAATDTKSISSEVLRTLVDNNSVTNISSVPRFAKISDAFEGGGIGLLSRVQLDATNTKNWTKNATGQPFGLSASEFSVRIETGSTGTVTGVGAVTIYGLGEMLDGALVINWYQLYIGNVTGAGVTASKLANQYGLYIEAISGATTLNYAIYSAGGASYHAGSWNQVGNLIAGGLDAAATTPADGTIRGSNVATGLGQTNQPGADVYFKSALGTGTGDAGQLIFQTAQAAATGDNIHTLETILTLDEDIILAAKSIFIGADVANSLMTLGLHINQGAADNDILALASSDVAHGITTWALTDVFATFSKSEALAGGLQVAGYKDADGVAGQALKLVGGLGEEADTTKTTAAIGVVELAGYVKSGTSGAAVGADGNIVTISTWGTARFIFDTEGSGHADVAWTTYDKYDDLALVRDMERVLQAREDEAKTYRRHALEDAGIIGQGSWHEEHGKLKAMVNFTKLAMLHHGALLQTSAVLEQIEERLAIQEQRVALLEGGR